jgi:hypothetical protein
LYKVASDKHQSALRRGRLSDWVNGEEWQSAETKLRQMQEGVLILENRIKALATGRPGVAAERQALGLQKQDAQTEINKFRKAMNIFRQSHRNFEEVFVDTAKAMLPKVHLEMLMSATKRECERRKKELEDTPIPGGGLQ